MSGPKVVRIVTREEILEICYGQLARVDAAIEAFIKTGTRNDCIDQAVIAAIEERRKQLADMVAADQFVDFQKQATLEEAFLREDLRGRLKEAAARQASARSAARRGKEAAAALLKALRTAGAPMDNDLEKGLERADANAVARGLMLLGPERQGTANAELAARLKERGSERSFAEWIRQTANSGDDPAIARIERRIAEIAQFGAVEREEEWKASIAEAGATDGARRHLILDRLEVQTGQALTSVRERAAALSELRLTIAEARAAELDPDQLAEGLDALDSDELVTRKSELDQAIEAARTQRAIAARRLAVLKGLSALGYEVNEGMETLWASEGRLVLKSAARPDYGVELAGSERVQMRPVAFEVGGAGPDASRDRDAETIWCGDVTSLRERLANLGDRLDIERAQPVGAVPIKRIQRRHDGERRAARAPNSRTLRQT